MSHDCSEQSSVIEAESAAKAAAASEEPVAYTALNRLRSLHLEKVIDQANWDCEHQPDFRENFLAGQYQLAGSAHLRTESESGISDSSSMAVSVPRSAVLSISPSSSGPPSLGSYSSVRSTPSVRTINASIVVHQNVLQEGEDGALRAPVNTGNLACCFHFLACSASFNDLEEWDTHCRSHLRGKLPKEVYCPFVCDWATKCGTGEEAWQERIDHIDEEHTEHDRVDIKRRPSAALIGHLWRHRLIGPVGKKELEGKGRITNSDFSIPAGRNRDRRQDRQRPQ